MYVILFIENEVVRYLCVAAVLIRCSSVGGFRLCLNILVRVINLFTYRVFST